MDANEAKKLIVNEMNSGRFSLGRIETETGIPKSNLSRFKSHMDGLGLNRFLKLMTFLGYKIKK